MSSTSPETPTVAASASESTVPPRDTTFLDNEVPVILKDGRKLTTYRAGKPDAPNAIVLETGGTVAGAYWGLVVEQMEAIAGNSFQIVVYDRAGYGTSSPANDYRTLRDLANDLNEVLDSLTFQHVVLVGHSWGGPIIRVAASLRPDKASIAGLVLVDATDELCPAYFGWYRSMAFWGQSWLFQPMAWTGRLREKKALNLSKFPEPYRTATIDKSTHMNGARAAAYELGNITAQLTWLRDNPADIGSIPVTVVSAQMGNAAGSMRAMLIEAHKQRAELAGKNGKYVPAEKSMHNIPTSQPDLIANEAVSLFAKV